MALASKVQALASKVQALALASKVQALALRVEALALRFWPWLHHWPMPIVAHFKAQQILGEPRCSIQLES